MAVDPERLSGRSMVKLEVELERASSFKTKVCCTIRKTTNIVQVLVTHQSSDAHRGQEELFLELGEAGRFRGDVTSLLLLWKVGRMLMVQGCGVKWCNSFKMNAFVGERSFVGIVMSFVVGDDE
jgi:hypothetical protein